MNVNSVSKENAIVEGVTAAFLMVRKKLFNEVGKFNISYKDIYQDVDFNLKIAKKGYINFCIREKAIIHVDHATRLGDGTKDSPRDFAKFKNEWVIRGPFSTKDAPRYSVLVCVTNTEQLQNMFKTIRTRDEYEFIFVNNKRNFMSSATALNVLTSVSRGEVLIYVHQDVSFNIEEPFSVIDKTIDKLGNNFGIMGPAGVQYTGGHNVKGVDFSSANYSFDAMRVQTIDEFCMITKRSNKLKFGEYLNNYHFYGADVCCSAMEKKLRNYVINLPMTHHSGGEANLMTTEGYMNYVESGRKFYREWGKKYPKISTTTTRFQNGHIYYFLGHLINIKKGINMTPIEEVIEI